MGRTSRQVNPKERILGEGRLRAGRGTVGKKHPTFLETNGKEACDSMRFCRPLKRAALTDTERCQSRGRGSNQVKMAKGKSESGL